MQALLDVILPVFFVVGLGYVVVWRKVFSTAAVDGLMTYTQNFAIPCLLFMALIKIDLGQAYSFRLMGSYYIGGVWICSWISGRAMHLQTQRRGQRCHWLCQSVFEFGDDGAGHHRTRLWG